MVTVSNPRREKIMGTLRCGYCGKIIAKGWHIISSNDGICDECYPKLKRQSEENQQREKQQEKDE